VSRVLWLHQNFVGEGQPGNARAVYLLRALDEAQWQVDVVSATQTYLGDVVARGGDVEGAGRVRVHRLDLGPSTVDYGARPRGYLAFARRALALARRLPRPDLVFASSPPLPQVLPSALLSATWGVPLVLEVRDLWPAFLIEGGLLRSRLLVATMRAIEAFALRYASRVVLVSPGFLPAIEGMGVDPTRTRVVPTGVDPILARADRSTGDAWRLAQGLGDRFLVLYAGSFNETYGIDLLLAAAEASQHEHARIVWLFAGNGRARAAVEEAALRLPNVRHLGSLMKSELTPVLLAADVGINAHADWPLLDTTLTGKLFDYLAAGLPVISLRGGTMGLLLELTGGGRVVATRSVAALLAEVRALAAGPEAERRRRAAASRAWSREHLDADAFAREIVQELGVACREGPRGGLVRLMRASLGALADVAGGRPERALAPLRDARREPVQRAAFERWAASL
jgi:glycosyltransferase involved in cell wall biosynthesis